MHKDKSPGGCKQARGKSIFDCVDEQVRDCWKINLITESAGCCCSSCFPIAAKVSYHAPKTLSANVKSSKLV